MKEALRILLVEDEFMTRRLLKSKLAELGHQVAGEANNVEKALELLEEKEIDFSILDINLGDDKKDGIWLGEYIRFHHQIPFVYLTAYHTADIVDRAINTQPHAYLTKPFNDLSLKTTLAIASQQHLNSQSSEVPKYLTVKEEQVFKRVLLADITYIESDGNYLLIHTQENSFRYRGTIGSIIKSLPAEQFVQTHRAFIVNKVHVNSFSRTAVFIGSIEIPVSKAKASEAYNSLGAHRAAT